MSGDSESSSRPEEAGSDSDLLDQVINPKLQGGTDAAIEGRLDEPSGLGRIVGDGDPPSANQIWGDHPGDDAGFRSASPPSEAQPASQPDHAPGEFSKGFDAVGLSSAIDDAGLTNADSSPDLDPTDSVGPDGVEELAPYPAMETLVDARHKLESSSTGAGASGESVVEELSPYGVPRPVFIGVGFGILGLVLAVGFFLDSGETDGAAVVGPPEAPLESTAPSTTAVTVTAADDPAAPGPVADLASAAFPSSWNFTATKEETVKPAPDFITATPVGAQLPWSVEVAESCNDAVCTYTSVVRPLISEGVVVPSATWTTDGTKWSLDVTWVSGAECPIEDHWTYEFNVTEAEVIDGRSVATAFVGTWVQVNRSDSCAGTWELEDRWSLVGVAG